VKEDRAMVAAAGWGVMLLLFQYHVKQAVAWGVEGHHITCLIAEVNAQINKSTDLCVCLSILFKNSNSPYRLFIA